MDPGVRCHGMKANPLGYLWSTYECFLTTGCFLETLTKCDGNAYDRGGDYNSSFALQAVELKIMAWLRSTIKGSLILMNVCVIIHYIYEFTAWLIPFHVDLRNYGVNTFDKCETFLFLLHIHLRCRAMNFVYIVFASM